MMQVQEDVVMTPRAVVRARRGISRYGVRGLAREVTLRPLRPVLAPFAARRLHELAADASTVDELLDLVFDFDVAGITVRPGQVRWEFTQLLNHVQELRPRRVLEIGTANGGSLLPITRLAAPDAHIISVDLHHGEFGGGYPAWRIPLYKAFARSSQRLDLIRGDSHDHQTFERVRSLLGGAQLDLLFIDGDHTFDGVRQDFEIMALWFGPVARSPSMTSILSDRHALGWPALHGRRGPPVLARDQPERDSEEFVAPSERGCFGIGLLHV